MRVFGVSEDMPMGLAVAEKLFGLILIIIGAIVVYASSTNPPAGDISKFLGIFVIAGVVLLGTGIFLVLTKTE